MIPSIFVQPPQANGLPPLIPSTASLPSHPQKSLREGKPEGKVLQKERRRKRGRKGRKGPPSKGGPGTFGDQSRREQGRAGQIKVPFFLFLLFYSFGELSWGHIHTSGGKGRESQQKSGRELQYTVIRIVCILFGDYNNCGVYVDALDPARACLTWLIVRVCCVCCVVSSQGDTRPVHAMQIALLGRWWYEFLEKKKPAKLDRTIRLTYTRT